MYICNSHDKIIKLANQIQQFTERDFETVKEALDEIESLAWDIRTEAETALEMGKKMEDRLGEYSSAIEDLGFKRVRE